jgi:hypothetical protein
MVEEGGVRRTVEVAVLHQGHVRIEVARALLLMAQEQRVNVLIGFSTEQPTMGNRCRIVRRFLEGTSMQHAGVPGLADWLLMIDCDNPPNRNPVDAAEWDLDVVGFPTPMWKVQSSPDRPIIWNFKPLLGGEAQGAPGLRVQEVESIGSGCILIARRVLEHPAMKAPFLDEFDEWGTRKFGGDITFCRRARNAGFRVWAAVDYPCGHVKEVDLTEIYDLIANVAREAGSGGNVRLTWD